MEAGWRPGVKQSPEITRTSPCYQRLINMEMQRGLWPLAHDCTCVQGATHWPFNENQLWRIAALICSTYGTDATAVPFFP